METNLIQEDETVVTPAARKPALQGHGHLALTSNGERLKQQVLA